MSKAWHLGKDSKTGFRFVFTRDSMEFYLWVHTVMITSMESNHTI